MFTDSSLEIFHTVMIRPYDIFKKSTGLETQPGIFTYSSYGYFTGSHYVDATN